jgi:hypothetical protein
MISTAPPPAAVLAFYPRPRFHWATSHGFKDLKVSPDVAKMRVWMSVLALIVACGGGSGGGGDGGLGLGSGLVGAGNGGAGSAAGTGVGGAAGGDAGATGGSSGAIGGAAKPIGGVCAGTAESASSCQGMVCLALQANVQMKGGICSKSCEDDGECGGTGFACLDLIGDGKSGYCLRTCTSALPCSDGFACVSVDDPSDPLSVCFVTETGAGTGGASGMGGASGLGGSSGTGGTSGGADCESKGCEIYTEASMVSGYCAMTPNAKKLCDCPTLDVPSTCKPTDPAAANLYCCP